MKKVMILGASAGQLPIIIKAKELGYNVAVVDYNDKAIGIRNADVFYHASTIDSDAVVKAAKDYQPDGITTVQTDMPIRAIAAATDALGLKGISTDAALKATDKEKMIQAFKENNVNTPWYYTITANESIDSYLDSLIYPCILKPSDNSGSRGVTLVRKKEELYPALLYSRQNSRSGTVIAEEYMQGPEVSVEVMMIDGNAHVLAVTDKLTTGAPHFVEMGHSQQSQLDCNSIMAIKKLAGDALRALGIQTGPGHVEIILTESGPKMVELGARLGGDFITSDLVPLSTGVDMLEATLLLACGEKPKLMPIYDKGSAIRFIPAPEGRIKKITGISKARLAAGIIKVELLKSEGDIVPSLSSSLDRVGYVIAQAESAEKAVELCEVALDMIQIVME